MLRTYGTVMYIGTGRIVECFCKCMYYRQQIAAQIMKGLTLCIFPGKREELETLIHEEFDSAEHEVLCVCLGKHRTLFCRVPRQNTVQYNWAGFANCFPVVRQKVDPGSENLSPFRTCSFLTPLAVRIRNKESVFRPITVHSRKKEACQIRIKRIFKNKILLAT